MAKKSVAACVIRRDGDDLVVSTFHGRLVGVFRDRVFWLMVLRVEESHRGRGIGTRLLLRLAELCIEDGVRRIEVDDMSDRFRMRRNIYRNLGFVYRRDTGPEMYAHPRRLLPRAAGLNSGDSGTDRE